jgi:poly(glycerol-phosphate) alpha-glucosyltransferase
MKRVAFVTTYLTRRGSGVFFATRSLAQSLLDSGRNEVAVFGSEYGEHPDDVTSWNPVPLVRLSARGYKFAYMPGLVGELVSWKPDVIHAHGIWQYLSLATLLAKARTGAKLVVSPHGQLAPIDLARSRQKKRLASLVYQNRQLRAADCLHALCELEVEQFRALGLANPISRIPNGTDLPSEEDRDLPPPWSGLVAPGRKVLLYLGRIHQVKGLDSLLAAWRDWKASGGQAASWVLALAG